MTDLVNRSSIPTKKILKLIEFCRPKNGKLPKLFFKDLKDQTKAYDCDFHYGGDKDPFIIFRINNSSFFPLNYQMRSDKIARFGYLGSYKLNSITEALIFVIAHEMHHNYIYQNPKTRNLYYTNPKKTETLADKFALRKLAKYKELLKNGINILK